LVDFKAESKGTDVAEVLKFMTNAIKKRCTAFVISDFKSPEFVNALKIANNKHDLMAVRIFDELENKLPNVGLIQVEDAETGASQWVDTSNASVRRYFSDRSRQQEAQVKENFKKSGVDMAEVKTGQDYVKPLVAMFKKREARA